MSISSPPPLPTPRSKFDPAPPEHVSVRKLKPFLMYDQNTRSMKRCQIGSGVTGFPF